MNDQKKQNNDYGKWVVPDTWGGFGPTLFGPFLIMMGVSFCVIGIFGVYRGYHLSWDYFLDFNSYETHPVRMVMAGTVCFSLYYLLCVKLKKYLNKWQ
ncbi:hypothetical protein [Teredinibacter sp. KSP-S5-2]|uniref:hypothetical protein n=1 Tax=Teredinibacter sp. KSP-S5-2 TaxID=3034506 RepID=UPI002934F0BA|nr:hypothetical protein [Teredinibacter sp. KSP-S5-2]WNO10055.1 hypothetical protein P5V12_02605 [Teredinibacter sp. KSP-S5-2]